MSEDHQQLNITESGAASAPRWVGLAVAMLSIACLAALGFGVNAAQRLSGAEQAVAQVSTLEQSVAVLSMRLAQAEETNAQVQGELGVVTDRLKLTQDELSRARRQTKQLKADYTKGIEEIETAVKTELAAKASADDVNTRLGAIGGDIAGVRSDLDATKNGFQMARSEIGTLIARNHEEIEQLRRLGQREYFEFTLSGKGQREKLGSVLVELRSTNTKKNHFTLAFFVDDLRLEKKNRQVNEPIYFTTRSTRAPLELVVNQVGKNKVVGYLSVPKAAAGAGSGTGF